METNTPVEGEWEFEQKFRKPLQKILNKYFPKVHEEGEEKRLMKRGEALVLYGEAVVLARNLLHSEREKERAEERARVVDGLIPILKKHNAVSNKKSGALINELIEFVKALRDKLKV